VGLLCASNLDGIERCSGLATLERHTYAVYFRVVTVTLPALVERRSLARSET
jgi:hypothetical protein